jgi:hypothetical protein
MDHVLDPLLYRQVPKFHLMAQFIVYALKGPACHARVTPATSPASHCKRCSALKSPSLHVHGCASPSRARRGHKNIIFFQWVQNFGTWCYKIGAMKLHVLGYCDNSACAHSAVVCFLEAVPVLLWSLRNADVRALVCTLRSLFHACSRVLITRESTSLRFLKQVCCAGHAAFVCTTSTPHHGAQVRRACHFQLSSGGCTYTDCVHALKGLALLRASHSAVRLAAAPLLSTHAVFAVAENRTSATPIFMRS